jgi:hypothetical protein
MIKTRLQDQHAKVGTIDENGFLRIKLRLGKIGVFPYRGAEVPGFEDDPEAEVPILVDEAVLFEPESVASLEGIPVTVDHAWLFPGEVGDIPVGAVAGTPKRNGDLLEGRALITNQPAIERIRKRELIEISPAYSNLIASEGGEWRGIAYKAKQNERRYNHIALLLEGEARGGSEMKITDKKDKTEGVKKMAEDRLLRVKTPYGIIETDAGGERVLTKLMDAAEEEVEEKKKLEDQMSDLPAKMAKIEELNGQIAALQSEKEALMGELETVKSELDRIASPEVMAEQVAELAESQDVAAAVAADSLPTNWKTLPVKALKKIVVENHFMRQGKTMDAATLTESFIDGAWRTIKTFAQTTAKSNVPVAGLTMDSARFPQMERSPAEKLGFANKTIN